MHQKFVNEIPNDFRLRSYDQDLTKPGNIRKIPKRGRDTAQPLSPSSRNEALGKTLKNYEKAGLKTFCSCPM